MTEKFNLQNIVAGNSSFDLPGFVADLQGFAMGLRHTHWETKSYAMHKTAELIQGDFEDLIDDFVEAYVGSIGGTRPTFDPNIEANDDPERMIACLKNLPLKDTSLLNIRDELLHQVYKFKYLKTFS